MLWDFFSGCFFFSFFGGNNIELGGHLMLFLDTIQCYVIFWVVFFFEMEITSSDNLCYGSFSMVLKIWQHMYVFNSN
jgi:hypothetical protein